MLSPKSLNPNVAPPSKVGTELKKDYWATVLSEIELYAHKKRANEYKGTIKIRWAMYLRLHRWKIIMIIAAKIRMKMFGQSDSWKSSRDNSRLRRAPTHPAREYFSRISQLSSSLAL